MVQIVRVEGVESLRRKYAHLGDDVFPSALARAVNRVSNTIKSRSAKDISEATGLKQSSVRRRIKFVRRATKSDPSAVLEMSGKPFNLVEFVSGSKEPRRPRGGVTANAWGRRRKYPGVFLARMPNGQVIAVQRSRAGRGRRNRIAVASAEFAGRSGPKLIMRGRWAGKSPHIEAVFGAGIAREASAPVLAEQRQRTMTERLPIELRHEIDFALKRLAVKRGRALRR
jgi:minor tail protein Z (GPZ)